MPKQLATENKYVQKVHEYLKQLGSNISYIPKIRFVLNRLENIFSSADVDETH